MTDNIPSTDAAKAREGIIDELETINHYEEMAQETDDPRLREQFEEIMDDERVHVGNFAEVLSDLDPRMEPKMREGLKETTRMMKIHSFRDMMCGISHFQKGKRNNTRSNSEKARENRIRFYRMTKMPAPRGKYPMRNQYIPKGEYPQSRKYQLLLLHDGLDKPIGQRAADFVTPSMFMKDANFDPRAKKLRDVYWEFVSGKRKAKDLPVFSPASNAPMIDRDTPLYDAILVSSRSGFILPMVWNPRTHIYNQMVRIYDRDGAYLDELYTPLATEHFRGKDYNIPEMVTPSNIVSHYNRSFQPDQKIPKKKKEVRLSPFYTNEDLLKKVDASEFRHTARYLHGSDDLYNLEEFEWDTPQLVDQLMNDFAKRILGEIENRPQDLMIPGGVYGLCQDWLKGISERGEMSQGNPSDAQILADDLLAYEGDFEGFLLGAVDKAIPLILDSGVSKQDLMTFLRRNMGSGDEIVEKQNRINEMLDKQKRDSDLVNVFGHAPTSNELKAWYDQSNMGRLVGSAMTWFDNKNKKNKKSQEQRESAQRLAQKLLTDLYSPEEIQGIKDTIRANNKAGLDENGEWMDQGLNTLMGMIRQDFLDPKRRRLSSKMLDTIGDHMIEDPVAMEALLNIYKRLSPEHHEGQGDGPRFASPEALKNAPSGLKAGIDRRNEALIQEYLSEHPNHNREDALRALQGKLEVYDPKTKPLESHRGLKALWTKESDAKDAAEREEVMRTLKMPGSDQKLYTPNGFELNQDIFTEFTRGGRRFLQKVLAGDNPPSPEYLKYYAERLLDSKKGLEERREIARQREEYEAKLSALIRAIRDGDGEFSHLNPGPVSPITDLTEHPERVKLRRDEELDTNTYTSPLASMSDHDRSELAKKAGELGLTLDEFAGAITPTGLVDTRSLNMIVAKKMGMPEEEFTQKFLSDIPPELMERMLTGHTAEEIKAMDAEMDAANLAEGQKRRAEEHEEWVKNNPELLDRGDAPKVLIESEPTHRGEVVVPEPYNRELQEKFDKQTPPPRFVNTEASDVKEQPESNKRKKGGNKMSQKKQTTGEQKKEQGKKGKTAIATEPFAQSASFAEMLKSANNKQWKERGLPAGAVEKTLPAYYRTVNMGCDKKAINVYEHEKMPQGEGISVKTVTGIGPRFKKGD